MKGLLLCWTSVWWVWKNGPNQFTAFMEVFRTFFALEVILDDLTTK
jgi:hypothetical protein